jgi:hypothetical protein
MLKAEMGRWPVIKGKADTLKCGRLNEEQRRREGGKRLIQHPTSNAKL